MPVDKGVAVGALVGVDVGKGVDVGALVGVGVLVGTLVGVAVGILVGVFVGATAGVLVGKGVDVGSAAGPPRPEVGVALALAQTPVSVPGPVHLQTNPAQHSSYTMLQTSPNQIHIGRVGGRVVIVG